jgi:hypothetical protein
MSRTQLPDRCMSDNDIRRTLEAHVFDGTEAVEAIVLVTSASRPPNLRTAIEKFLKLKYAGAVHLDAVRALWLASRDQPAAARNHWSTVRANRAVSSGGAARGARSAFKLGRSSQCALWAGRGRRSHGGREDAAMAAFWHGFLADKFADAVERALEAGSRH